MSPYGIGMIGGGNHLNNVSNNSFINSSHSLQNVIQKDYQCGNGITGGGTGYVMGSQVQTLSEFQLQFQEQQQQLHEKMQQIRKQMHDVEKEKAILLQKIEQLEMQVKESKEQEIYYKKSYECLLNNLNSNSAFSNEKAELELELRFLKRENQELKENSQVEGEYLQKKYQEVLTVKSQLEKEFTNLKLENLKLKSQHEDLSEQSKRDAFELYQKFEQIEKEKMLLQVKVEDKEEQLESKLGKNKKEHEEEMIKMKKDYEEQLQDIKKLHQKDKQFLEDLLKRNEERLRKGNNECTNYLEMENKYLRDIKDLNDSFDEYKKQVEKHIAQLNLDKQMYQKMSEDSDLAQNKLKQTLRSVTTHNEQNTKRLREKLVVAENELCAKTEENSKLKSKILQLRTQVQKLEFTEKKLRTIMYNKEAFMQQFHSWIDNNNFNINNGGGIVTGGASGVDTSKLLKKSLNSKSTSSLLASIQDGSKKERQNSKSINKRKSKKLSQEGTANNFNNTGKIKKQNTNRNYKNHIDGGQGYESFLAQNNNNQKQIIESSTQYHPEKQLLEGEQNEEREFQDAERCNEEEFLEQNCMTNMTSTYYGSMWNQIPFKVQKNAGNGSAYSIIFQDLLNNQQVNNNNNVVSSFNNNNNIINQEQANNTGYQNKYVSECVSYNNSANKNLQKMISLAQYNKFAKSPQLDHALYRNHSSSLICGKQANQKQNSFKYNQNLNSQVNPKQIIDCCSHFTCSQCNQNYNLEQIIIHIDNNLNNPIEFRCKGGDLVFNQDQQQNSINQNFCNNGDYSQKKSRNNANSSSLILKNSYQQNSQKCLQQAQQSQVMGSSSGGGMCIQDFNLTLRNSCQNIDKVSQMKNSREEELYQKVMGGRGSFEQQIPDESNINSPLRPTSFFRKIQNQQETNNVRQQEGGSQSLENTEEVKSISRLLRNPQKGVQQVQCELDELLEQMKEENTILKNHNNNLTKQVEIFQNKVRDLKKQLQEITEDKAQQEKEMQGEIRFLLQQIMHLKSQGKELIEDEIEFQQFKQRDNSNKNEQKSKETKIEQIIIINNEDEEEDEEMKDEDDVQENVVQACSSSSQQSSHQSSQQSSSILSNSFNENKLLRFSKNNNNKVEIQKKICLGGRIMNEKGQMNKGVTTQSINFSGVESNILEGISKVDESKRVIQIGVGEIGGHGEYLQVRKSSGEHEFKFLHDQLSPRGGGIQEKVEDQGNSLINFSRLTGGGGCGLFESKRSSLFEKRRGYFHYQNSKQIDQNERNSSLAKENRVSDGGNTSSGVCLKSATNQKQERFESKMTSPDSKLLHQHKKQQIFSELSLNKQQVLLSKQKTPNHRNHIQNKCNVDKSQQENNQQQLANILHDKEKQIQNHIQSIQIVERGQQLETQSDINQKRDKFGQRGVDDILTQIELNSQTTVNNQQRMSDQHQEILVKVSHCNFTPSINGRKQLANQGIKQFKQIDLQQEQIGVGNQQVSTATTTASLINKSKKQNKINNNNQQINLYKGNMSVKLGGALQNSNSSTNIIASTANNMTFKGHMNENELKSAKQLPLTSSIASTSNLNSIKNRKLNNGNITDRKAVLNNVQGRKNQQHL